MDKLFKEIKNGDLILGVSGFKLRGKAKYVFAVIKLLAPTRATTSLSYPIYLRSN